MKRQRTSWGNVSKKSRSKQLIVVAPTVSNSGTDITLFTATSAGQTIKGFRFVYGFDFQGTAPQSITMAIVVCRDGFSPNSLSMTQGNQMYEPEEDVLWFDVLRMPNITTGPAPVNHVIVESKTSRKMREGDTLRFIALGTGATAVQLQGVIQFFVLV